MTDPEHTQSTRDLHIFPRFSVFFSVHFCFIFQRGSAIGTAKKCVVNQGTRFCVVLTFYRVVRCTEAFSARIIAAKRAAGVSLRHSKSIYLAPLFLLMVATGKRNDFVFVTSE